MFRTGEDRPVRQKHLVCLTESERQELELVCRQAKGLMVKRAYILLKADQGWSDAQIQEAYGVGHSTVERIRQRYATSGLNGALNRKPSQRVYRKKIEGEEEAYLIALACSEPPEGRASWTLRLLADKLVELKYVESVSYETVRHVLKKTSSSLGKTKNGASRQSKTPALSARWKKF